MPTVTRGSHKRPGEADTPARYLGREIELPPDPEPATGVALRDVLAILFLLVGTAIVVVATGALWGFWVAALVLGALALATGFVLAASS